MKKPRPLVPVLMMVALSAAGCATPGYHPQPVAQGYPQAYPQHPYPAAHPLPANDGQYGQYGQMYGTVESIQAIDGGAAPGIGMGAVVGGVVGGMLGNQVGGGNGRKAATVAGVVGGAMVGHQMERNSRPRGSYQVGVRLDNGRYHTAVQENVSGLYVGGRVRVDNNQVYRY